MSCVAERKKILVVEDDPCYAKIVEFAFERANLPVDIEMVNNGEEAVFYLSRSQERQSDRAPGVSLPNLILTDINMPGLSGLDLLAWIRKNAHLKHLPVVVMSGYIDPFQVEELTLLGASSYFVKPLTLHGLLEKINNIDIDAIAQVEAGVSV